MGKVVNLRGARKARARAEAEKAAAENRVAFGRTKEERALRDAEDALAASKLDAHKRARDSKDDS
ncbi:MAG: DUF4169 family protein [Alphaproteobacteria bacterium]|nr:DUF4169 family protein [Alphaproteobacteria bacterium]